MRKEEASFGKKPLPRYRQAHALEANAECRDLQTISSESSNRRALTGLPEQSTANRAVVLNLAIAPITTTSENELSNSLGKGMNLSLSGFLTSRDAAIGCEDTKLSELQDLLKDTLGVIHAKRTVAPEVTQSVKDTATLLYEILSHRKMWKDAQRKLASEATADRQVLENKIQLLEEQVAEFRRVQKSPPRSHNKKRPAPSSSHGPEENIALLKERKFTEVISRKMKKARTNRMQEPASSQLITTGSRPPTVAEPEHRKSERRKNLMPNRNNQCSSSRRREKHTLNYSEVSNRA